MTEQPSVTIGFLGDIMLARGVEAHYLERPHDFAMQDIRSCLADCDHVHANLETPVSRIGTAHPKQDPNVCFCADPRTLGVLNNLRVSSVSLANNHVLDYGPDALTQTQSVLDQAEIARLGAGSDWNEANSPLICKIGPLKVAIVASNFTFSASTRRAKARSPGAADHRLGKLEAAVRSLQDQVDLIIVSVHWGLEYSFYPLPYIQRAARRLVDSGAQLVIGHGPHYVQPIERYGAGCIAYSLGNFVFDEPFPFANVSYVLKIRLRKDKIEDVAICPVEIENHVPRLVQNCRTRRIKAFVAHGASRFSRKSRRFWQDLSNTYLRVMLSRALKTQSFKYLTANPLGFYRDIGIRNYLAKLRLIWH
ncbi:MAG: CapA family protein [Hyphomicrobiaceae bacterium]